MNAVDDRVALPLGSHVLLGDTRTAALSAPDGSIVWMCVPAFDGPPLFGRLIGGVAAGEFTVAPLAGARRPTRRYLPGSPVAETTWKVDGAELVLTEGMVAALEGRLLPSTLLVRRVDARGAPVRVRLRFSPRLGVQRAAPHVSYRSGQTVCTWGATAVNLAASTAAALPVDETIEATVEPGRPLLLSLGVAVREPLVYLDPVAAWSVLQADEARWRRWSDELHDLGPFHDAAARSLLTLQLLTYSPSGAPVAAPTTSLPEQLGGERNWDYRFAWPRDASIGISAFLGAGKVAEARSFLFWLLHATRLDRPRLRPLLTLYGKPVPAETSLDDWPGYGDSRPVRFGNSAGQQHQLDVYGWVLQAAWAMTSSGHGLYAETWRALAAATDLVAGHWSEPDAGIWEVRGEPRQYVHSKLMAWLALDRALRIAQTRRVRRPRQQRWVDARADLAAELDDLGFDPARSTFTRTYGSDDLDAALLLLPVLEFEDAMSPRVIGTVDAVRRELSAGGPLLYRYRPLTDGIAGQEGAFLPCSFWLVQALASTGRVDEAVTLFEELLGYGGDLGLFPEEIDVDTGELLGNYPQALTHAALVQAALAIRDATRVSVDRAADPAPARR